MMPHNGLRTTIARFLRRLACRIDVHSRVNKYSYCTACESYEGGYE